jgi:hypothetical protein
MLANGICIRISAFFPEGENGRLVISFPNYGTNCSILDSRFPGRENFFDKLL